MSEAVVIAEKTLHKGAMFGHISNGGGTIDLGNGKAVKFTALNEKFVKIQVLESGIGSKISTQSWQKVKKVVEKKIVEKKPKMVEQAKLGSSNKTVNPFE